MKDFFNRKNVAVTITLVVIAIALVIGFTSAPKQAATSTTSQTAASVSSDAAGWAKKNYGQYEDFLEDDADLFSDTTLETFAKYNAQLDYTYGSIMGLVTTDSLDGKTMEDYAMDESADLELGDSDMLLLIDTDTEQWYLAYGNDMASYVDNDLSILFKENLGSLFTGNAGSSVTGLYKGLLSWYASNIPVASHEEVQTQPVSYRQEERMSFGSVLLTLFIILIVLRILSARDGGIMTTACTTAAVAPASGAGCLSARCSGATAAIARPRLPVQDPATVRPPAAQDPVDLAPVPAAPASNRARAALAAAVVEAALAAAGEASAEVRAAEASAAVADKIRNRHFLFWECRFFENFS